MSSQKHFLPADDDTPQINADHIRKVWHNGEWYFSVVDVIAELLDHDHKRAKSYWSTLKDRLKQEGNETVTKCDQLKMLAPDNKMRLTDVVNTEQALRLIQSIPSPKVEPFKRWLAQVGAERLEETQDPEAVELRRRLSDEPDTTRARQRRQERRLQTYRDMGRDDDWIATRELSIITRKQFVEMIQALLGRRAPFARLTNDVYEGVFHKNAAELRQHLHLQDEQNPRDHFSVLALAYTIAAESASKIKLERYQDDEYLPVSVVRDVIIVLSKAVGIQADQMAELLQIDILTGMPLLNERV